MRIARISSLLLPTAFFCLIATGNACAAFQQDAEPVPQELQPHADSAISGETTAEAATAPAAETIEPAPETHTVSTVVTSIPECAAYVSKVRACIAHLSASGVITPETRTDAYRTLQQIIGTWQKMTDREALARTCTLAYQRSGETYNSSGCDF